MIPVYKPYITERLIKFGESAIRSGWISSNGMYVDFATDKLKRFIDSDYVLLTSNGTVANHLMIKCLHKFYPQVKRIAVPNNVYVSVWNSLLYDNFDYEFVPIDASLSSWNMSTRHLLEKQKEFDAIYVTHNLGNVINVYRLKEMFPDKIIFEDACEAFGGYYNSNHAGTESVFSTFSFFGNKNITCGEGGAFVTKYKEIYDYARKIFGQGQTEKKFIHDELGYNYRLNNVSASMLYAQIEDYPEIAHKKDIVFSRYRKLLRKNPKVRFQIEVVNTKHSNWMFGIRIRGNSNYDDAYRFFKDRNIETRPLFYPVSYHKHLQEKFKGKEDSAKLLNKEVIILPSYPELTYSQQEYIAEVVEEFSKNVKI